jgi:hypothetical protein
VSKKEEEEEEEEEEDKEEEEEEEVQKVTHHLTDMLCLARLHFDRCMIMRISLFGRLGL